MDFCRRGVSTGLAAVAVVVAAIVVGAGTYVAATGSASTKTVTNTSTLLSMVSTTLLNTLTSTTTALLSTTTTLVNTITTTASTTLFSTTTATSTATTTRTASGPYTVNVAYKAGTGLYFTNATGFTLYFRATDPGNGTSTCTGSCVTVWPLFYAAPGSITVPPGLSVGSFGVASRSDGKLQTTYNGYPLYYYENDLVAGQIAGQGKGNFYPCCSVDATSTTTSTSTSTTTTTASTSTGGAVAKVSIPSGTGSNPALNYNPSSITVVIGVNNTVMWTNNDAVLHTVVSDSIPSGAASFDGSLNPGTAFSVTFTVAGTYQYYCDIHPWMMGTVTVLP